MLSTQMTYATMFTGGGGYLKGVIALLSSLREVGSRYPLTVFVTASASRDECDAIEHAGAFVVPIEAIEVPEIVSRLNLSNGFAHWNETFAKIRVFSATQFSKIVLLDSDMMIVRNVDELFQLPHFSACVAGHLVHPDWVDLNSGCMVIEPEEGLAERMLAFMDTLDESIFSLYRGFGDQDLLHLAYPEWPSRDELHLSESYNLLSDCAAFCISKGLISERDVAIVHFAHKPKPWSYDFGAWLALAKRSLKHRCLAEIKWLNRYRLLLRSASITGRS